MDVLQKVYYGNTVQAYLIAAAIAVAIPLFTWMLERVLVSRLRKLAERSSYRFDDLLVEALSSTKVFLVALIGLWVATVPLTESPGVQRAVRTVAVLALLFQIGIWVSAAIGTSLQQYQARKQASGDLSAVGSISMLALFARILLWAIVAMLVLDNVGVDITALVTGLGIGGIAVALAAQKVLGDLFASVSIVLDKPFQVGDNIQVADLQGVVEQIGLKTTRVRAISGEQLIFSNSDLLASRIRNLKRMEERRVLFEIGIAYETPVEQIAAVPTMLRESVESQQPLTRFDRAHFKKFGDSALIYEIAYFVTNPKYAEYMDVQQGINLELFRRFRAANIEIAYPTRTLYLRGEPEAKQAFDARRAD